MKILSTIRGVFDFIRMWLLLRALDEQEERQVAEEKLASAYYSLNRFLYVDKHGFAVAMSNLHLFPFLFPLWLRFWWYKGSPKERGGNTPKQRRLRRIYTFLNEAEDYITIPSVANSNETEDELKGRIRLCSAKSKEDGKFFISYFGGLNGLLKTYPAAWALVPVLWAPQWLPWLLSHTVPFICAHASMLNWCHV